MEREINHYEREKMKNTIIKELTKTNLEVLGNETTEMNYKENEKSESN